jgi:hypothetical protein
MPDYAASDVRSVAISAFNVILFGIITMTLAHVSKRWPTS